MNTLLWSLLNAILCFVGVSGLRGSFPEGREQQLSSFITTLPSSETEPATIKSPIKVILLAGQSNMVGMASTKHLRMLINGTSDGDECPCEYQTLWNGTGFRERDDVYMQYLEHRGKLRAGWYGGGRGRTQNFGPEVGIGWELGDIMNETFIMIKSAYGGRSLGVDFRPPASGEGTYDKIKPSHYGWEYRAMIDDFREALSNLTEIYPEYDDEAGYVLVGLVWFHGWNDLLNWPTVLEYEYNLVNMMRDLRLEFDEPSLPYVIGELGMHGLHPTGRGSDRVLYLRGAQENATRHPEFQGDAVFVRTAPFMKTNVTSYNGGYHYFGRADIYYHIGRALGRGMWSLIQNRTFDNVHHCFDKKKVSLHTWIAIIIAKRKSWESDDFANDADLYSDLFLEE